MSRIPRGDDSGATVDPRLETLIASSTGARPSPEYWIETTGTLRARREVEEALRASADPIVITGPSGHGKSLVLRWLWRHPPSGFAPILVPSEAEPGQIAAAILSETRACPVDDPAGSLARSLRTQALRGGHPMLLVDDFHAMPAAALSELLAIVAGSRVEVRWVGAGREGAALDAVLRVLGRKVQSIALDAPWTRADAERLVARVGESLPIGAADALAAIDLGEALRTSHGNPRLVCAALAARLREMELPQVEVESDIPPPTAALAEIRASSEPAAISGVASATELATHAIAAPVEPLTPPRSEPSTLRAPPQSPESALARAARLSAARAAARLRAPRTAARRFPFRSEVRSHWRRLATRLPALRSAARLQASRFAQQQRELVSTMRSHAIRFAARLPELRSAARSHASRSAGRVLEFGEAARARVPHISARTGFAIGSALAAAVAFALIIDRAPAIAAWSAETADAYRSNLSRTVNSWTRREPVAVPVARVHPRAAVVAQARIRVAVNSEPWSNVEIDGEPAGSTPLTIELAPGRHTFRAAMADGRVVERKLEVTADRNRVVLR